MTLDYRDYNKKETRHILIQEKRYQHANSGFGCITRTLMPISEEKKRCGERNK